MGRRARPTASGPGADVRLLREALADVEKHARRLPWAGRPGDGDTWTTRDYVKLEDGLPTIDLHDLDGRLAEAVVRVVVEHRTRLGPEVRLITGRGQHSAGGKAVLRDRVRQALADAGVAYDAAAPGHLDVRLAAPRTTTLWSVFLALFRALAALFVRNRRR